MSKEEFKNQGKELLLKIKEELNNLIGSKKTVLESLKISIDGVYIPLKHLANIDLNETGISLRVFDMNNTKRISSTLQKENNLFGSVIASSDSVFAKFIPTTQETIQHIQKMIPQILEKYKTIMKNARNDLYKKEKIDKSTEEQKKIHNDLTNELSNFNQEIDKLKQEYIKKLN